MFYYPTEMVPDMQPNTRGLFHINSGHVRQMGFTVVNEYLKLLENAAEEADLVLTTKTHNLILMIGWTPK
jgi:hypothetical protein